MQPGFGNGVRFVGVTPEHEAHLRRFIETIASYEPSGIGPANGSGI
jgi:hypothetical protein